MTHCFDTEANIYNIYIPICKWKPPTALLKPPNNAQRHFCALIWDFSKNIYNTFMQRGLTNYTAAIFSVWRQQRTQYNNPAQNMLHNLKFLAWNHNISSTLFNNNKSQRDNVIVYQTYIYHQIGNSNDCKWNFSRVYRGRAQHSSGHLSLSIRVCVVRPRVARIHE